MRIRIGDVNPKAEGWLPENEPDGSGVGVNYTDAYLKPIKLTLEDGRKLKATRRGLEVRLTLGTVTGAGLLRRREHGTDVRAMLRRALDEAAEEIGVELVEEDGALWLETV